jgi:hypothetical protein
MLPLPYAASNTTYARWTSSPDSGSTTVTRRTSRTSVVVQSTPTSSRTSRSAASSNVSPASRPPPGGPPRLVVPAEREECARAPRPRVVRHRLREPRMVGLLAHDDAVSPAEVAVLGVPAKRLEGLLGRFAARRHRDALAAVRLEQPPDAVANRLAVDVLRWHGLRTNTSTALSRFGLPRSVVASVCREAWSPRSGVRRVASRSSRRGWRPRRRRCRGVRRVPSRRTP